MSAPLRQTVGREVVKATLSPMLRWKPMAAPEPGYTVVLGVPWDLRHLLPVNVKFMARTDLSGMKRLHVVFDRRKRPGMDELEASVRKEFPHIPFEFSHYPGMAGRVIEKVNVSTFYNSMNTVIALGACRTKYAILHDFDLFPIDPRYFAEVHRTLAERKLRFAGIEATPFDGLSEDEKIVGTWCLGIDVEWLRANWRPIDCFHRVAEFNGRKLNLDPYSWIQTKTPERDLVTTLDRTAFCHVQNLCSTYLRFITGRKASIVWRLHYVWYLETLTGNTANFDAALAAMENATSSTLVVNAYEVDFKGSDPGCAGFLDKELRMMETALFGHVRPEVERFTAAFDRFLRSRCT